MKDSLCQGRGIFKCSHFGQNGSSVLGFWCITYQVCLEQNGFFPASVSYVKVFRSTFRAMSFQDLHWLLKLGSRKLSFGAKVVAEVGAFNTLLALISHFTKPFPQVVVLGSTQEDTKM